MFYCAKVLILRNICVCSIATLLPLTPHCNSTKLNFVAVFFFTHGVGKSTVVSPLKFCRHSLMWRQALLYPVASQRHWQRQRCKRIESKNNKAISSPYCTGVNFQVDVSTLLVMTIDVAECNTLLLKLD